MTILPAKYSPTYILYYTGCLFIVMSTDDYNNISEDI